jgi:hypothetical protein
VKESQDRLSSFSAQAQGNLQNTPAYDAGVAYLNQIRSVLPNPQMVDIMDNLRDRVIICNWIGQQIDRVNTLLQSHLDACHHCFVPLDRRSIQIFAVPLATSIRLDGFCNINTTPTTILVDVGRVAPPDWLALVAHEYAHAHLGYAGHDRAYAQILSHLCLGLGLSPPSPQHSDVDLYSWPPYPPALDPLAFWRGEKA